MTMAKFLGYGVRWQTVSFITMSICQLVIMLAAAKILGPEAIGLLALGMMWVRIAQPMIEMGLSNSLIQAKSPSHFQISSILVVQWLSGFILFSLSWTFIAPFMSEWFDSVILLDVVKTLAWTFLLAGPGTIFIGLLKRQLKFKSISKIQIFAAFVELGIALWLLAIRTDIFAIIYAFVAKHIVLSVVTYWSSRNLWTWSFKGHLSSIKGLLKFGVFDMASQMINQMTTQIDRILIGKFLGQTALGYYVLAWDIMSLIVGKISGVYNYTIYPLFAKIADSPHRLSELYGHVLKLLSILIWPLLLFCIMFAEPLIQILIGPDWISASPTLQVLCLAGIYKSISSTGYSLLLAKAKPEIGFKWNFIWLVLLATAILVSLFLFPSIESVAWTVVLMSWSTGWIWHSWISKNTGVSYRNILGVLIKVAFMIVPTVIFWYAVGKMVTMNSVIRLSLVGAIGMSIFALSLYMRDKKFVQQSIKNYL